MATDDAQIIPPNTLVTLARAEIDQQIATARAYPRDMKRAATNIHFLATIDEETAAECMYALPRGGKPITGPSIRLAEIIISQWGNSRSVARVVEVNRQEKYLEAEGIFHDLETNTATNARVRRRISNSRGQIYNDDMITTTGNAACSIAKRNAILGGIPKAVWRSAYDAALLRTAGDVKVLAETRSKAVAAFAAFGVTPERVAASIGYKSIDEITHKDIPTLRGMHAAIKSGEETVESMFPMAAVSADKTDGEPAKATAHKGPPPPPPAKKPDTVVTVAAENVDQTNESDEGEPDKQPDIDDRDIILRDLLKAVSQAKVERDLNNLLSDCEEDISNLTPPQKQALDQIVSSKRKTITVAP